MAQAGDAAAQATGTAGFFNREVELAELDAALAAARTGQGEVVVLSGEAGIGKTRLARVFLERARGTGATALWGAAWDAGGAPAYWPWIQALRGLVDRAGADAVRAVAPPGPHPVAHLVPELGIAAPEEGLDADEVRFALFDAAVRILRALGTPEEPLLVVLDDLHAADPGSLLLLEFAARSIADAHVLVVGTVREELVSIRGAEDVAPLARVQAASRPLRLRGLGRTEVAAMVDAQATTPGTGAVQRSFVRRLHVLTDGNPLFLTESLRLLDDAAPADEVDVLELALPQGLREAIRERLDRLPEDVRAVLEVASVVGREFRAEAVAKAADRPLDEVLRQIDEAVAAAVLRPSRRRPGRFSFTHSLVREALHDALPARRRAELHRDVAIALETLDGAAAEPAEIAHHWLEAAPAGEADRAVNAAQRAAEDAMARLAYEQAEELHDASLRALELLPADPPRRLAVLLGLGDAQIRAGRLEESRRTLRDASALATRLGDGAAQARAALTASPWGLSVTVDDAELVWMLERALRAVDGEPALRARLLSALATAVYWSRPHTARLALVEEAIALARASGDQQTLARVLADAHIATWDPDSPGRSLAWADEIEELEPGGELVLYATTWRIALLLETGDLVAAGQAIAAFARQAEASHQPRARRYARRHATLRALLEGRFDEVEQLLAAGGDDVREGSVETLLTAAQAYVLRWMQGRLDELLPAVQHFADSQPQLPVWRCALAGALHQAGRDDEMRRELDRLARGGFAELPRDNMWLPSLALLTDAVEALGDARAATAMLELLDPFDGRWVVIADAAVLGPVARFRGRLLTVAGDPEAGLAELGVARRQAAAAGAAPVVALLAVDEARARRARGADGDAETARGLLADARRAGERLGLRGVVAAVDGVDGARPPAAAAPAAAAPVAGALLERTGDAWRVARGGPPVVVRDVRGMHHLARLLAEPEVEVHALDLAGGAPAARGAAPDGLDVRGAGEDQLGPLLDEQAKAAYRERLSDLEAEIEEAEAFHDGERAARAREERDALAHELAAAVGLGGRDRKTGSSAERARVNVTRAIKSAIERIGEHDPALARHLESCVRTGTFCSYRPEPGDPTWEVRP